MYWQGKLENFADSMLANPFSDAKAIKYMPALKATKTAGMAATAKRTPARIEVTGKGSLNGLPYTMFSAVGTHRQYFFWGADSIAVDDKCAETLCRLYGMPINTHVPLYLRHISIDTSKDVYKRQHVNRKDLPFLPGNAAADPIGDMRQGSQIAVVTKSWKKIPFNANDFAAPVDYRQVQNIVDVTYSTAMKSELTTALDAIGFSSTPEERLKEKEKEKAAKK